MGVVDPHQLDLWSSNVQTIYNALEGEILRIVIDRLNTGDFTNIESWQLEKMQQLRLFNSDVMKILAEVTPFAEKEINKYFQETVGGVIRDVDSRIPVETIPITNTVIDSIVKGYVDQSWSGIDNLVNQTLVSTNYGGGTATEFYTKILNKTSALFNTGIFTFEDALERSISEMAEGGIKSSFIDQGGHRWSLERYAKTVMKSTLNNTYDEVKKQRMAEYGQHLVLVSSHIGAREACFHIQGNVVDLRDPGDIPWDSKYKSIYDSSWGAEYGTKGGHRGINCAHNHTVFIDGVNINNMPKYDKAKNDEVVKHQDRQRAIERNIVKYKKRLMVNKELGTDKVSHYQKMVDKWDNEMSEHLKNNGEYLGRNLPRERVYTPLETLMKEPELYL